MDGGLKSTGTIKALITLDEKNLISKTSGSISERVDATQFVIMPLKNMSNYKKSNPLIVLSIKTYNDADYNLEAGLHASVYQGDNGIGAVIHTHQPFASIASASGFKSISFEDNQNKSSISIPVIDTKNIDNPKVIKSSEAGMILLKRHGAICFGKDIEQALERVEILDKAIRVFLSNAYIKRFKERKLDEVEMYAKVINECMGYHLNIAYGGIKRIYNASRNRTSFLIYDDENQIKVKYDRTTKKYPEETKMYNAIFKTSPQINHIVINNSKAVAAMVAMEETMKPMLEDFAKRIGTRVRFAWDDPRRTSRMLRKTPAAKIPNVGVMCCGKTLEEAEEVSQIIEKNCRAYLYAWLFGKPTLIRRMKAKRMRRKFLKAQSKGKTE